MCTSYAEAHRSIIALRDTIDTRMDEEWARGRRDIAVRLEAELRIANKCVGFLDAACKHEKETADTLARAQGDFLVKSIAFAEYFVMAITNVGDEEDEMLIDKIVEMMNAYGKVVNYGHVSPDVVQS